MLFNIFTVFAIVHLAHSQVGFSSIPCSQQRNARIVGGFESEPHEIPSIVSLSRRGGHFCGGTIIHEKFILTAGHCICNGLNKVMKPQHIEGVIGLHSISKFLNGIQNKDPDAAAAAAPIQVHFKNIIPHPNYQCTSTKNDIALLELLQPIRFSRLIQPSCLKADILQDSRNQENELATVAGWGWTQENQAEGDRADGLRKAVVRIWNNNVCERSYQLNGRPNSVITDTQMCAGYEKGGIDSCWADSGGPLMSKENLLMGVVSTGIGCARPGLPGIYTRVSKYIQWMEDVIFSQ